MIQDWISLLLVCPSLLDHQGTLSVLEMGDRVI
jgi:hypothetical protein